MLEGVFSAFPSKNETLREGANSRVGVVLTLLGLVHTAVGVHFHRNREPVAAFA